MAARTMAEAGLNVLVLEARGRAGGRIQTLRPSDLRCAVELGAEFVHGEAPLTRQILDEAGVAVAPLEPSSWQARSGKIEPAEAWESIERVLGALDPRREPDRSFAEFLRSLRRGVLRRRFRAHQRARPGGAGGGRRGQRGSRPGGIRRPRRPARQRPRRTDPVSPRRQALWVERRGRDALGRGLLGSRPGRAPCRAPRRAPRPDESRGFDRLRARRPGPRRDARLRRPRSGRASHDRGRRAAARAARAARRDLLPPHAGLRLQRLLVRRAGGGTGPGRLVGRGSLAAPATLPGRAPRYRARDAPRRGRERRRPVRPTCSRRQNRSSRRRSPSPARPSPARRSGRWRERSRPGVEVPAGCWLSSASRRVR